MTSHTPGPWHFDRSTLTIVGPDGHAVAYLGPVRDPMKANARLLAAAPELLEALRWFVDDEPCRLDHNGYCQTHGLTKPCSNPAARAVIAKAEGRE